MKHDVEAHRRGATRGATMTGVAHRPRGLALIGLLTVLDGAWGALVPFIGPLFGYRSHGQSAWQWSSLHGVLYLAPGAVAVLFGLIILARARSVSRGPVGFAGLVVAACGAWFVVGPALWPTFGTGPVFTPASSAMDNFVHQVGYNLGVGVILAMLGGMALKALTRDRAVAVEGREPYDERGPSGTVAPAAATPVAEGREPYVGDRHPVEPTRREAMTPGAEPVADRDRVSDRDPVAGRDGGADRERLEERDRGPGATPAEVGNGRHQQVEGERVHREGGEGVPAEGVAGDRVPPDGVPGDRVPADSGHERRGLRRLFSR